MSSEAFLLVLLALAIASLALCLFITYVYKSLIKLQNDTKNAFSQIDVHMKRRHDLISTLIAVCQDEMDPMQKNFAGIIAARNNAVSATTAAAGEPTNPNAIDQISRAETSLNKTLHKLFNAINSSPAMTNNKKSYSLLEELQSTENKTAFSKETYNDTAEIYNIKRESFPTNVISTLFYFKKIEYLKVTYKNDKNTFESIFEQDVI